MDRRLLARALALLAMLFSITMIALGSLFKPGYSQLSNYISELAATGTSYADAFAMYGFLPVAVLLAGFLWVAAPLVRLDGASRVGYWLLLSQPLAYAVAALAPCDPGCPMQGSATQQVHNLLGLVTYLSGGAGIFLMASCNSLTVFARTGLVLGGIAWSLSFVLMPEPMLADWRGLLQRIAETVMWLVMLFIAFGLVDAEETPTGAFDQR